MESLRELNEIFMKLNIYTEARIRIRIYIKSEHALAGITREEYCEGETSLVPLFNASLRIKNATIEKEDADRVDIHIE